MPVPDRSALWKPWFGTMALLLVLGFYHGAMERMETGEGPLYGHGLDGDELPDGREPRLRR